MKWKDFPAWLKCGIIGIIIGILTFLGNYLYQLWFESTKKGFIFAAEIETPSPIRILILFPFMIDTALLVLVGLEVKGLAMGYISSNLLIFSFGLLVYFLIGAFIGWIVGKIKSKKCIVKS